MKAARLHAPRDLRVDDIREPPAPGAGEVLLHVTATGICGSDLHTFQHGRIGDTKVDSPLVLGHEFAAVVVACGPDAADGIGRPLRPGARVAVDPATSCGICEMCRKGNPNLCTDLHFRGLYPDDGCLRERLLSDSRSCFLLPDSIDEDLGALLEPFGVAIHATRLAKLKRGDSAAVIGAGPVGQMILQLAKRRGADPVFVSEPLPWRLALAERFGGAPIRTGAENPVLRVLESTGGRGVDVTFEAAWADETVQQAGEMTAPGGRVILVGIPADDQLSMKHSTGRRKGLTLFYSRRMKHTYPEAMRLVDSGEVDLRSLISHRFPLAQAPEAFALNAAYANNVVKVIIGE